MLPWTLAAVTHWVTVMAWSGNVVLTCNVLSSLIEIGLYHLIGGIRCAAISALLCRCVKVSASFR